MSWMDDPVGNSSNPSTFGATWRCAPVFCCTSSRAQETQEGTNEGSRDVLDAFSRSAYAVSFASRIFLSLARPFGSRKLLSIAENIVRWQPSNFCRIPSLPRNAPHPAAVVSSDDYTWKTSVLPFLLGCLDVSIQWKLQGRPCSPDYRCLLSKLGCGATNHLLHGIVRLPQEVGEASSCQGCRLDHLLRISYRCPPIEAWCRERRPALITFRFGITSAKRQHLALNSTVRFGFLLPPGLLGVTGWLINKEPLFSRHVILFLGLWPLTRFMLFP